MKARLLALGLAGLLLGAAPRHPPERPVDLNTATATELLQLPRIGPRTAERILAFRREHGPFRNPEELMNVKGIGPKSFRRLRPHLTVTGAPPWPGEGGGAGAEGAVSRGPRPVRTDP